VSVHTPSLHACPFLQTVPQSPQLRLSAPFTLMHLETPALMQTFLPGPEHTWQVAGAAPAMGGRVRTQVSCSLHFILQAPQFSRLVVTSTQVPAQSVRPVGQAHFPPTQILPPVHLVVQLPQKFLFVRGSTQVFLRPHLSGQPHLPAEQMLAPVHVVLQLPQDVLSVLKFTQRLTNPDVQ